MAAVKLHTVTPSASSSTVSVLLGNGDGSFGAQTDYGTGYLPTSVAMGDFNADGKPDLATANGGSSTVSVLLGNGDGSIGVRADYYGTGSYPYSVTIDDHNDGGPHEPAAAN